MAEELIGMEDMAAIFEVTDALAAGHGYLPLEGGTKWPPED